MTTTLTFVRHGNTDYNREKRAQGHLQNPLNDTGRKQAAAVAKRLAEEEWDVLVASDLLRARETAEIISAELNMPIAEFDTRLREIDKGQITDTTEAERVAKWGKDWHKLDLGEESDEAIRSRGISFVNDMTARYPGKKILAVSHGYFMGQTLRELLKDESLKVLNNTSVSTIAWNGGAWECKLYNCTKHLTDADQHEGQSDL